MNTPTNSEALPLTNCSPSDYDAGLLNDFGGGDVGWWQDYLRAEIGRANDYWREQYATAQVVATDAIRELDRILDTGDTYASREIVQNLKDFLRGDSLENKS